MQKECIAHIESNGNGWYSVYCEEEFPFGFFGEGATIEAAKQDFLTTFDAFCNAHMKRTGEKVSAIFTFELDDSAIEEMHKINVIIKRDDNGICLAEAQHQYNVGLYGTGATAEEALADLKKVCEEAREFCAELPNTEELTFNVIDENSI